MSETWLTRYSWCTRQSWRSPTGMTFWPAGRMTVPARVIVVHSTETVGFPGYNSGAAAPHFTIDLPTGLVRQHVPLEWGSRCLAVSSDGVTDRTVNVTGTIQIETIGAVTPGYPKTFGHYDLPNKFPNDQASQRHMARLFKAIHDATGIPLQLSSLAKWVRYPQSYGVRARQRLNSANFRAARGIVGHQHAVANNHGDGVLGRAVNDRAPDMESVVSLARGVTTPPPADVSVPVGSTWEVTAVELNCRSGPGTEHQVTGSAKKGVVVTATGKSSGPWIEAQTPYQRDKKIRAWWHSGFLARTTSVPLPKPDQDLIKVQQGFIQLNIDVGTAGADGFYGPDTRVAVAEYSASYGYTGDPMNVQTLLAHLERTMTNILNELKAIRDEQTAQGALLRQVAAQTDKKAIGDAVWGYVLYGLVAHQHLRMGLITSPTHRNFPADPGSISDWILRKQAAENDGFVSVYTGSGGMVELYLDPETNRFVQAKEN